MKCKYIHWYICIQVMSATVAKALKLTGNTEALETATFIEMVDKLFDTLNVSTLSKGKLKCKPFVQQEATDFRLKVRRQCLVKSRVNNV